MLFKNKNKDTEVLIKESAVSEETIKQFLQTKMKKERRWRLFKQAFFSLFMIIGLLGGYKSWIETNKTDNVAEAAESQTFVKTFIERYYEYPETEESKKMLSDYLLEPAWKASYSHREMTSAKVIGSEVYKVKTLDDQITSYYLYVNLETITTDKEKNEIAKNETFNVHLDVAKEDGKYLIISPIRMTGVPIQAIEKEQQEVYKFTPSQGTTPCTEEEKRKIENTLKLFFTTYSKNKEQTLLQTMNMDLEDLDPNTTMEFQSITSATSDETTFYVNATIKMNVSDVIEQELKMYFEINIDKNKITKMEGH